MVLRTTRLGSATVRLVVGLASFAILTAATAAVAGAGVERSGAMSADRARTVIIGGPGVINTLDPLNSNAVQTGFVNAALYDKLVTYNSADQVVGRLATAFKLSKDAKSISIKLRSGVKFHDGRSLTAKDVAFTLDRLKKKAIGSASFVTDYKSTTVTTDTDLVINLDKPSSLFLGGLSQVYILNSELVKANAGSDDGQSWLQSHEAGSGPYTLDGGQMQASNYIVTNLYPGYWESSAGRPASIVFRLLPTSGALRDEVNAGSLDVALFMTPLDTLSLRSNKNLYATAMRTLTRSYIVFNTSQGDTAKLAVRKAVQLAFNYYDGLKTIRSGFGTASKGILPGPFACQPPFPVMNQNLTAARKILSTAGIKKLELTMKYQPTSPTAKSEAVLLQSNLSQIGVKLKLEPITFPEYLLTLQNYKTIPQMILLNDFAPIPDPGIILQKQYLSTAVGTNRGAYKNPAVDKLLLQAARTADDAARCDLYKKAQTLIYRDAVAVNLYTITYPIAYRVGLKGIAPAKDVLPIDPTRIRLP
jgi:peptide/nickel transport system substrate-binding protein